MPNHLGLAESATFCCLEKALFVDFFKKITKVERKHKFLRFWLISRLMCCFMWILGNEAYLEGREGVQNFAQTAHSPQTSVCKPVSTVASVKHDIPEELLSALLAEYIKPEDLIGKNGLHKQLTRPWLRNPYRPNTLPIMGHECHETITNGACSSHNV
ncbi:hypothetical protein LZ683_10695 [Comamonas testosteroni]|nr:hypothetical protein [Comamonas testosteroni]WEE79785.1 hypothetical protein LZ683_10695 [Comamonas testosteroni]